MAVVTGITFAVQKKYAAGSMGLITPVSKTGVPLYVTPRRYPYETGGITVAVPTTFVIQEPYAPSSFFEGTPISQYGLPLYNQPYREIGMVISEQKTYIASSLNEATVTQSNRQGVTGLDKPPPQFWS